MSGGKAGKLKGDDFFLGGGEANDHAYDLQASPGAVHVTHLHDAVIDVGAVVATAIP